jgi:hypothetical protein
MPSAATDEITEMVVLHKLQPSANIDKVWGMALVQSEDGTVHLAQFNGRRGATPQVRNPYRCGSIGALRREMRLADANKRGEGYIEVADPFRFYYDPLKRTIAKIGSVRNFVQTTTTTTTRTDTGPVVFAEPPEEWRSFVEKAWMEAGSPFHAFAGAQFATRSCLRCAGQQSAPQHAVPPAPPIAEAAIPPPPPPAPPAPAQPSFNPLLLPTRERRPRFPR